MNTRITEITNNVIADVINLTPEDQNEFVNYFLNALKRQRELKIDAYLKHVEELKQSNASLNVIISKVTK